MKIEKNIGIAFFLNLFFSIFEMIGGIITGSIAIISDSVHDFGDAMSIGIAYFLEKKSEEKPNNKYTYGYIKYSVMGSILTTTILIVGSIFIIYESIKRLINPVEINYNGMIIIALFGVTVNLIAAYKTSDGKSLNQKAVNLHMIEDVLGWIVVLIGSILMKFTNISIIDPILSLIVAIFILIMSLKNANEVADIFLEKTPSNVNIDEVKKHLLSIKGVKDIHHIHVRTIDGYNNFATLHAIIEKYDTKIKEQIKEELKEHNINHSTIEIELENEKCKDKTCHTKKHEESHHHH